MEESREETEKEPQGSNEKVSKTLLLGLVTNGREIDKIQKSDRHQITPPCERCAQADEPCLWKA
jgi:hypothetical protein